MDRFTAEKKIANAMEKQSLKFFFTNHITLWITQWISFAQNRHKLEFSDKRKNYPITILHSYKRDRCIYLFSKALISYR